MIPELPFGRLAFARCFKGIWQNVQIFEAAMSDNCSVLTICQVISRHCHTQTTRDIKGGLTTVASDVAENYPHSPWQLIVEKMTHFRLGPAIFSGALAVNFQGGSFSSRFTGGWWLFACRLCCISYHSEVICILKRKHGNPIVLNRTPPLQSLPNQLSNQIYTPEN